MSGHNEYALIADLYDAYVQTTLDIPFFLAEAKKSAAEVLELMCGTGRVSVPLAEAGARLTCVDLSAEMLSILGKKLTRRGLQAQLVQADVARLDLGRQFDLILLPFNSFGEILSPPDQMAALHRIHSHLAPGGRFICTLHNPDLRAQSVDGQLHLLGKFSRPGGQGSLVMWIWQDYANASQRIVKVLQFYEEYNQKGVLEAKRMLEVHFCLVSREEFEAMAQQAGFRVDALYGNYDCAPFDPQASPFLIWILREA